MTRALIPGSFDPITLGHIDVVERCQRLFSEVIVAVADNQSKRYWFTRAERIDLASQCLSHLPSVKVVQIDGLLATWCVDNGVDVVVKGIRSTADAAFEIPQATVNRQLGGVETVFLPTSVALSHISSTLVKEVALNGGNIETMVPSVVADALHRVASAPEGKEQS